jgi:hypothetical protein
MIPPKKAYSGRVSAVGYGSCSRRKYFYIRKKQQNISWAYHTIFCGRRKEPPQKKKIGWTDFTIFYEK